ncbi:unnamed protein product [Peniophora sp. CBMAI 1063]|nr:unnamed protein product [Peniophora sp. CBMAI 1063]
MQDWGAAGSPLRHLDVEIYEDNHHQPINGTIAAEKIQGLRVSSFARCRTFLYSDALTSLSLYHDCASNVVFESSFSEALFTCRNTLEYLTIDAGGASFESLQPVLLPQLHFLRVLAPEATGGEFMRSLTLPANIDLHLEPVVKWRRLCKSRMVRRAPFEVPYEVLELEATNTEGSEFSQYASALAAPDQTATSIFHWLPPARNPSQQLWLSLFAIGIDIRLDPSIPKGRRVAGYFPELTAVVFASSPTQLHRLLQDPCGRDWGGSEPMHSKQYTRRSITARDGDLLAEERRGDLNTAMPKALYDSIRYTICAALATRQNNAAVREQLEFAPESWLPDRSLGYAHILDNFGGLRVIRFTSPWLEPDAPFHQGMQGQLAFSHLHAFGIYLNTPCEGQSYPCPLLETVLLPPVLDGIERSSTSWCQGWGMAFNSPERLGSGLRRIEVGDATIP